MNDLFSRDGEDQHDKALQDRVRRIIEPLIPRDAQERVTRAYKQWNLAVRGQIRDETGLRLSDGDAKTKLPVKIIDGFPVPLARFIDSYGDPILWLLIVGQPKLGGIIEGLNFLLPRWGELEAWPILPEVARGGEPYLQRTLDIADTLQRLRVIEEARQNMKQINHDILGVYRFASASGSHVELYWMAIAMVAAILDVRIEDLTVVVLAHELTHGYTHVGCDIDGIQWQDQDFDRADPSIVEGLAQFYTETVVSGVAERSPGPKIGYERLLELQSGPYLAHRKWFLNDAARDGEVVRLAMVKVRRDSVRSNEEWLALLDAAKHDLGGRGNRGRRT
jgi:hypothetical protein